MRINDTVENLIRQINRLKEPFGYLWVSQLASLSTRAPFRFAPPIRTLKIGPRSATSVQGGPLVSDPTSASPGSGTLQFDHADRGPTPAELTCAACKQPIRAAYYDINGNLTCQRCRGQIVGAWNRGSPAARFAKALLLGGVAAALGAGLYFGIEALTGYEFGLVAVVVGFVVGAAVRKGSNGRGGWRYQALAMFLTYSAVVATDSSLIARELVKQLPARTDSVGVVHDSTRLLASAAGVAVGADSAGAKRRERPGLGALLLGLAVLLGLAYAAPIAIGISSPIHLLIAGFAIYEAWKLNRGMALRVTGPYQVAPRAAPA